MIEFVNGMYLYIAEDIVSYLCSVYEKKSKGVEKKVDGLPQLQRKRRILPAKNFRMVHSLCFRLSRLGPRHKPTIEAKSTMD